MTKDKTPWFRIRRRGHEAFGPVSTGLADVEKAGETLTPNLRALRLAMTASEVLLSMGIPANSVVSRALDITETYCDEPVHVDIIYNLIMVSQVRGLENEPLTLIRPVVPQDVNNMTVQSVQQLIYEISHGQHSLAQAETRLDKILNEPITYPGWLVSAANASIAAAVALMFSTNWRVVTVTFVIAVLVDRLVALLIRQSISSFFRQAAAGIFVTLAAAVISLLDHQGVGFFWNMNPTLIVVGGIIMLVAGLAIVGAVQDAIEEYYITATARVLRVFMLTAGLVMGILIGLYTARKLGIGIAVSPNPLHLTGLHFQIIGGGVAAAAFAVATQTRLRAVVWAGLMGGAALVTTYAARRLGVSAVPAAGVAAALVGVIASLFSRRWRTPSSGVIAAGIVPLVPGLAIYNSLMQLIDYPPGNPLFYRGLGTLFTAAATALAIAAGASFGSMLARPIHRQLTHTRNVQPFIALMHWQLKSGRKSRLARLALLRSFAAQESDEPNE